MKKSLCFVALLVLGVSGCSSGEDRQVVTAAGAAARTSPPAEATTTTGLSATTVPAPLSTPTGPAPSSTTSTTTAPRPTTTTAVAPTSTTRRVVTTTTTTFPSTAVRLTIRNEFVKKMDVTINGARYLLSPGETRGPVPVVPKADHNDTYSIFIVGTMCGMGDAGPHFQEGPGSAVTLHIVAMGPESLGCPEAGPDTPNFKLVWEGAWSGGH